MSSRLPTGLSNARKQKVDPESISSSRLLEKKRVKRAGLGSTEKCTAINIYKYIENSTPMYPIKTEIKKTAAEIMGISMRTMERILREYRITGRLSSPDRSMPRFKIVENLDDFTLSAIRREVHKFYFNNDLPTIDKVLKVINDNDDLPSFTRSTMYRILKKLNFEYVKRSKKGILLDRQDLVVWRRNYLLKMKNFRKENRKIYYIDETWINQGHTPDYVWVDEDIKNSRRVYLNSLSTGLKSPPKGRRLIVTHIGSVDGFLKGGEWIFEDTKSHRGGNHISEMDGPKFEKWFEKILNLVEPGSVIVLDNAPYHSRLVQRVPNLTWRKADIQYWLQEKQITFDEEEIKAELLTKFKKEDFKKKVLDVMAATKNVIILQIPPYHCELNPLELIWAKLKSHVGRNNKTFKMKEVKELTKEGINNIDAASWAKCIEHIKKEEDKLLRLDDLMDMASDDLPTPSFNIDVSDNSTTTSTDTDD